MRWRAFSPDVGQLETLLYERISLKESPPLPQYIYKSAHELAKLIRERRVTSVDVVKEHVTRIRERNGELNAFVNLFEEEALSIAAERDQQVQQGELLGPLHGVPVSVKEQFWIEGKRTTINAKMHKDFVAPEDAVIVDRIRKSGAVIRGPTNIPKFVLDYQVGADDFYPEGKNPYNTECTPGGSTGGGAAAVAAGFSTLELEVIWEARSAPLPTSAAFMG